MSLSDLKNFLDLGGTFILALVVIYYYGKKLDNIENLLTKVIALIYLNHSQHGLKEDADKVLGENVLTEVNKLL